MSLRLSVSSMKSSSTVFNGVSRLADIAMAEMHEAMNVDFIILSY